MLLRIKIKQSASGRSATSFLLEKFFGFGICRLFFSFLFSFFLLHFWKWVHVSRCSCYRFHLSAALCNGILCFLWHLHMIVFGVCFLFCTSGRFFLTFNGFPQWKAQLLM